MKKKEQYSFARLLILALKQIGAGATGLWIASNLVSVVHGMSWGLGVWATQLFFDAVTQAAQGIAAPSYAFWMLMLLGGVTIGQQVLNGIHNFMGNCYFEQMNGHMIRKLAHKAARIDPVRYESPDFLDDVNKAGEGANHILGLQFTGVTVLTFYLPYFLYMAAYLYTQKPILALSIVLVFVPVALTQFIRSAVFAKLEDEAAPLRRRYEYYEKCLTDREFFKETRLLGSYGYFARLYRESLDLLNKKTWAANRRTALWELTMKAITLAGYFGILYMLVDALMAGEISVGAFAAVFSSLGMLFGIMDEVICRHIGSMTKNLGAVRNFARFLDAPERGGEDAEVDAGAGIDLDHVTFRYPGAERDAVKDISMKVAPGQTLAIVGENGAGKTTLVRLMTGIYLPDSGEVALGGKDTKALSMRSVYGGISAVFQKYQRYRMTLNENVAVADLGEGAEPVRVGAALEKADLSDCDEAFPNNGDTMLSREFDGVDLSGGQWQRVAIARGFYRAHGLIVLDEPTAAIDPLEETRVYRKFAELSKCATAVIVTHRMGSARIADTIVVMDDGRIDDVGSHDELMARSGKYADMVRAQADWYV